MEKDSLLKTDDWVSRQLLPRPVQAFFALAPLRRLIVRRVSPAGMYEWVIARTRYIDAVFSQVQQLGFAQTILLGAGFDSRAVRFRSELGGLQVFELDAPTTQAAKISQYHRRGIEVPKNLNFVGINFERESLAKRLEEAGFLEDARTLVIMEGVTQYLIPEAVYATLETISSRIARGSWLVFDYAHASAIGPEISGKDEIETAERLARSGETWQFGLEEQLLAPLLERYHFKIIDRKNPRELEVLNFKNRDGRVAYHISDTQSIVTAEKA